MNQRLPEGYFAEPNVQFGIEIDVATLANLHDELLSRVGEPVASGLGGLYAAAYRPVERDGQPRLERSARAAGGGPHAPGATALGLRGGLCLPLDLPAAYTRACQDVRLPSSRPLGGMPRDPVCLAQEMRRKRQVSS